MEPRQRDVDGAWQSTAAVASYFATGVPEDPVCARCLLALGPASQPGSDRDAIAAEICRTALVVMAARDAALVRLSTPEGISMVAYAGPDIERLKLVLPHFQEPVELALSSGKPSMLHDRPRNRMSSTLPGEAVPGIVGLCQPLPAGAATGMALLVRWERTILRMDRETSGPMAIIATAAGAALDATRALQELEHLALSDPVSGLPNRRAWDEQLPRALASASRSGMPLCVGILDVDLFKALNDTQGHDAGDQTLRDIASAGTATMRQVDYLARVGGDEFAVILPGCGPADAIETVKRMAAALAPGRTFSTGIARWDGSEPPEKLMRRADAALYRAKAAHSGRISVARTKSAAAGTRVRRLRPASSGNEAQIA